MITEGSTVAYCGDDVAIGVGTLGRVMARASGYHHVRWTTGSREGSIDPVPADDLIEQRGGRSASVAPTTAQVFDDSLDTPAVQVTGSIRDVYDDFGEDGVLTALSETGHLASLSAYASDAIGHTASLLRRDPDFSQVLAQLDDQEADSLLTRVAVYLLRSGVEE